jgi:hypothetical protein
MFEEYFEEHLETCSGRIWRRVRGAFERVFEEVLVGHIESI